MGGGEEEEGVDTLGGRGGRGRNKRFHRIVGGEEEGPEEELLTRDASFSARGGLLFRLLYRENRCRLLERSSTPSNLEFESGSNEEWGREGGGEKRGGKLCIARSRGGNGEMENEKRKGRRESTLIRLFGFACLFGKYP